MRHERIRSFKLCGAEAERAMTSELVVGDGVRTQAFMAAATELEIPATLPGGTLTVVIIIFLSRGELGKKMGSHGETALAF